MDKVSAAKAHVAAVTRNYITQPRLSKLNFGYRYFVYEFSLVIHLSTFPICHVKNELLTFSLVNDYLLISLLC